MLDDSTERNGVPGAGRADQPRQQYQKGMQRGETVKVLTGEQRRILALDDEENDRLSANPDVPVSGFLGKTGTR
jgi:hypothetical protein